MEIKNKETCCERSIYPPCSCCIYIKDLNKVLNSKAKEILIRELQMGGNI